jgi:excisionase family DNA binding protein
MKLLSIKETAQALNIPTRTVYRLVKEGVFPKLALNERTIRIPFEEASEALSMLVQKSLVKGGDAK